MIHSKARLSLQLEEGGKDPTAVANESAVSEIIVVKTTIQIGDYILGVA